jgi:type VI secretion system protein ImpA
MPGPPIVFMNLPDLSVEAPAGENLELDLAFGALERAAQGRPETQYGDTINPAVPPDWVETETIALDLLERTRDLRVLTHLAVARLNRSGIPGFAEVLAQIRDQLENRWEQVHPQLDPEDDNDTTLRKNALFRLQDPANVLRPLRDLPLAVSPKTGPISWRDVAVFSGQAEPDPGREKPTEAFIRGGFQDTNQARLKALRDAVAVAVHEVTAIPAAFEARAGSAAGPDFTTLAKLLRDIQNILQRFEFVEPEVVEDLPETAPEIDVPGEDVAEGEVSGVPTVPGPPPRPAASRGPVSVKSITTVRSRDDALYCLELASGYFRANEPSSPVPMLIDRARRLAIMEFLDILRDLAPDGLAQAQIIAGSPTE